MAGDRPAESLIREPTSKLSESETGRIRWNLGEMYANGFGVQADKATAWKSRLGLTMTSRARRADSLCRVPGNQADQVDWHNASQFFFTWTQRKGNCPLPLQPIPKSNSK